MKKRKKAIQNEEGLTVELFAARQNREQCLQALDNADPLFLDSAIYALKAADSRHDALIHLAKQNNVIQSPAPIMADENELYRQEFWADKIGWLVMILSIICFLLCFIFGGVRTWL